MDTLPPDFQKRKELFLNKEGKDQRLLEDIYHQRTSGAYLSDVVFGANDGIVTTFAVIAGSQGASLSSLIVLILGFSNLFADGLSMGIGCFLGRKSESDYQKGQFNKELKEIKFLPEIEEYETRKILEQKGYNGELLENVYKNITKTNGKWARWMMKEELGITEVEGKSASKHGLFTFIAFVCAGLVPLLPFVFNVPASSRFAVSILGTAVALFITGALRSKVYPKSWWKAGLEMLIVGSAAAFVAYFVGSFLESFAKNIR